MYSRKTDSEQLRRRQREDKSKDKQKTQVLYGKRRKKSWRNRHREICDCYQEDTGITM